MGQNEHHEQQPECGGRHDEHVDGSDTECVVAYEGAPSRRRRVQSARHVLGNGCLTDLNAELEQLTVDARCTPERVGEAYLADQFAGLGEPWASAPTVSATASRVESPAGATGPRWPASQEISFRGSGATPVEPHPHQPIDRTQPQTDRTLTLQDRNLVTQGD